MNDLALLVQTVLVTLDINIIYMNHVNNYYVTYLIQNIYAHCLTFQFVYLTILSYVLLILLK